MNCFDDQYFFCFIDLKADLVFAEFSAKWADDQKKEGLDRSEQVLFF